MQAPRRMLRVAVLMYWVAFSIRSLGFSAESEVRKEVDKILDRRRGFRAHERVHALRLIDEEFKVEDGTLTPTLKMRRDRITARHAEEIEALFGGS